MTSVFGSDADRRGLSALSESPAALVTETAANRGSTASVYVSRTTGGGRLTTTLAVGTVRTSAACAQPTAGSASAAAAAKRTHAARARELK
jgi:hypothetical protein